METTNGQDADPNVRKMEAKLNEVLSPFEPLLMKMQSILVWENPRRSSVMIACVHALFWFLATTSYRVYFMVSVAAMVMFFVDMWKKKIWPEIRVPPSSPEDGDGWTPIHPRLLSVPEICKHLAELLVAANALWDSWIAMRKDRPLPFCLMNGGVCSVLAMVGHYVPGLMLSYILVISLLLWPCIVYHNLLQKIYLQGEPLFMRLDYCLKFRGRWPFKPKVPAKEKPRSRHSSPSGQDHAEVDTDSDLEEFVPSADPLTTAALARAITDSEDEGGTPLSTPLLSKEPSVSDHYTDEENDKDSFRDFARGLDEMPSFEEVLDQTDDESERLKLVTKPDTKEKILSSSRSASKESTPVDGRMDVMHFVPSHFRDSDSEEEHTLTRELSFPDIAEVSETDSTSASSASLASAVAASAMQQSLPTAMMSAALSGFNRLGESLHSAVHSQPPLEAPNVAFSARDADEQDSERVKFVAGSHFGAGDSEEDSEYSDDTEEADDFEFLDEEELENYEKNK